MSTSAAWLAGLVAALVTGALMPVGIRVLAKIGLVDVPNARSSHLVPVIRGAGVVLVAGWVAGSFSAFLGGQVPIEFVVLIVAMAALGLADDVRRGLSPILRLAVVAIGALVALSSVGEIRFGGLGGIASLLLATVWIVSFTNSFNFMDGVNAISGLNALVIGLTFAVLACRGDEPALAALALAGAGAAAGFLPFNAIRPRVFLGDAGSYPLGAGLALLAVLVAQTGVSWVVCLMPFLPYLADTGWTVVRRAVRKEHILKPHRQHGYQLLVQSGWTHLQAAGLVAVVTGLCAASAVLAEGSPSLRPWAWVASFSVALGYAMVSPLVGRPGR